MSDAALVDLLDELLARADLCSSEDPEGAPGVNVADLEREFQALAQRWIELVRGGVAPSFDALNARVQRWRDRLDDMPSSEQHAHFARQRVARGWYKLQPGAPDPELPDRRSAVGEMMDWLGDLQEALVYEHAILHRTTACDCEAAALARRRPIANLERIGPHSDGYYVGDELRCPECGTRWFAGIMDDSVGSTFWERLG